MIHTWKVLQNWAFKASLYFNKWWSIHNYNSKPFNPALTSLEEGASLGYIQKLGDPAQGGRKSQGDTSNQLKESPSMPDLCLAEPDLSLTECNCQSGGWSDWHLNLLTEASTKTHPDEPKRVEERGRVKFPIKDAEDQLWIWFDHLLQSRICQIQSIYFRSDWFQSNRLRIHWSRILDLLHYSSIY